MQVQNEHSAASFGIAKKRYAGWCTFYKGKEDDRVVVKGLEMKRSDSSGFTRKMQKDLLVSQSRRQS